MILRRDIAKLVLGHSGVLDTKMVPDMQNRF